MTRSPKNSSDGSTSSTSRSTTERSAGPTTQTTTSRSKPRPLTLDEIDEEFKRALAESERR